MCLRPSFNGWRYWDVSSSDYRTEYSAGAETALVIKRNVDYVHTEDKVSAMFVIRDANGAVVQIEATEAEYWADLWFKGYCHLDLPTLPDVAGSYSVELYFNNQLATTIQFKVN